MRVTSYWLGPHPLGELNWSVCVQCRGRAAVKPTKACKGIATKERKESTVFSDKRRKPEDEGLVGGSSFQNEAVLWVGDVHNVDANQVGDDGQPRILPHRMQSSGSVSDERHEVRTPTEQKFEDLHLLVVVKLHSDQTAMERVEEQQKHLD